MKQTTIAWQIPSISVIWHLIPEINAVVKNVVKNLALRQKGSRLAVTNLNNFKDILRRSPKMITGMLYNISKRLCSTVFVVD